MTLHDINADLHCHSIWSDGTLAPAALAARAQAGGVELWALTDHDELGGQAEAAQAARALGLAWISGVEISVSFAGETVHIVGLDVDLECAELQAGLAATRAGRTQRAQAMAQGLAAVGIKGAYEGALAYVTNPALVSRTHFARWLVDSGACPDTHSVFRRYLTPNKPGYVDHRWASLGDAVGWIRAAGGIAVIAHPGRYRFSPSAEYALFSEFKTHGGQGVEVLTGSHGAADAKKYAATAQEFGLLASRGSDFHSPAESRTGLGSLPALQLDLTPVWAKWADQIDCANLAQPTIAVAPDVP